MPKITPFLWFDGNVDEAVKFYTTIFKDSKTVSLNRAGADGPVISAELELAGQRLMLFNGGPQFKFNEAISLFVSCETQAEVDQYWNALSAGGQPGRCGWLKDKFGLSWQIVPTVLGELLGGKDPAGAKRAMEAMLKMDKLDIATLKRAYASA